MLGGLGKHAFDVAHRTAPLVRVPGRAAPPRVPVGKIQSGAQNSKQRHRKQPQLKGAQDNVFQSSLPHSQSEVLLQIAGSASSCERRPESAAGVGAAEKCGTLESGV